MNYLCSLQCIVINIVTIIVINITYIIMLWWWWWCSLKLQGKEKDENLAELAAELNSTRDKLAEVTIILIFIMIHIFIMMVMIKLFDFLFVCLFVCFDCQEGKVSLGRLLMPQTGEKAKSLEYGKCQETKKPTNSLECRNCPDVFPVSKHFAYSRDVVVSWHFWSHAWETENVEKQENLQNPFNTAFKKSISCGLLN